MTRDALIAAIQAQAEAIRAEGVTKLYLYGSRSRGDNRPDSDIDLLVEVDNDKPFSFLDLISVMHLVEDATGLPAQATMRRSLEPRFAERIADDIIEIF